MSIMGLLNWPSSSEKASDRFGGFKRLAPYRDSRREASSLVNPSVVDSSFFSISLMGMLQKAEVG
jgi:hypothetical protein